MATENRWSDDGHLPDPVTPAQTRPAEPAVQADPAPAEPATATQPEPETRSGPKPRSKPAMRRLLLVLVPLAALAVLSMLSVAIGARPIPLDELTRALLDRHDPDLDPQIGIIVWELRIPRTALGLLVGAALGLAGAVMQGLTRNPLADPGLLGVSAGAAFGSVLAVTVFGLASLYGYIWFALAGALAASVLVYLLGSAGRGGANPVTLALAGVAVTFLLSSLTSAIVLRDPDALHRYRFWAAGSLAGLDADVLRQLLIQVLPLLVVGAVLALFSAPALNSLALGEELATALGRRLGLIRLQGAAAIMLLAGAAVAAVGPIVFVGLVIPHIARILCQAAGVGPDYRWLLPTAMLLAPCLMLAADIAGRMIARPAEIPLGIVVAFIGAPFFIALVRRRRLAGL